METVKTFSLNLDNSKTDCGTLKSDHCILCTLVIGEWKQCDMLLEAAITFMSTYDKPMLISSGDIQNSITNVSSIQA